MKICPLTSVGMRRSRLRVTGLILWVAATLPFSQPADAKPDPKSELKSGMRCAELGATGTTDKGARLDCVKAGAESQWHLRGSKLNPFAWGETARVATEYETWRIAVTSVEPDVTERVVESDPAQHRPRAGAKLVGVMLELTYVGKNGSAMVRNGAIIHALGADPSKPILRWPHGTTEDDCWVNETVENGQTKRCMMPYEVADGAGQSLQLYAANVVGRPVVYFSAKSP